MDMLMMVGRTAWTPAQATRANMMPKECKRPSAEEIGLAKKQYPVLF